MRFEPVATGFALLEAPRVDARGVWFTDIILGGVRCLRPDGRIDAWLPERRFIGGLAFNDDGRVVCGGPGGLVWLDPNTGESGKLLSEVAGEPILGVNDLQPAPDGGLFFGTVDQPAIMEQRMDFAPSWLCRLAPDGTATRIRADLKFANGIGFSPDGRTLYSNDSSVGVSAYSIAADGSAGEGRMFYAAHDGDGLAVDAEGCVWLAGILSGELTRISPAGEVVARVPVPGGNVTSLCFGGDDRRDLYVTTTAPGAGEASLKGALPPELTATLYRARADVAGVPVPRTRLRF